MECRSACSRGAQSGLVLASALYQLPPPAQLSLQSWGQHHLVGQAWRVVMPQARLTSQQDLPMTFWLSSLRTGKHFRPPSAWYPRLLHASSLCLQRNFTCRSLRLGDGHCYMDDLKVVGEQSHVDMQNRDSLEGDLRARVADAKCRLCLHGSRVAIQSFAEFEKAGAKITKNPGKFTEMVVIMRNDSTREKADS